MKKTNKFLSSLLVLALTASFAPAAFAEGEATTVEPEILVYRDYEDGASVSAAHTMFSNDFNYGKMKLGVNNSASELVSNQVDGTAMKFAATSTGYVNSHDTTTASTAYNFGSGKLYIAYNSTATIDSTTTSTDLIAFNSSAPKNANNVLFGWTPGTNYIVSKKNWNSENKGTLPNVVTAKGDKDRFKVEIVFDTENKTAYRYVDGILVDTEKSYTYDADTSYYLFLRFRGQTIIDNFTMVNYKTGAVNTYSMSKGEMGTNTLSVFLKSDAADSDGKSTDEGTTWTSYSAPYGITLPSTDTTTTAADKTYKLAADTFTVTKNGESIAATSVTAGAKTGEYVITLDEAVDSSSTYTVTTKEGLADIVGATANTSANSVTFAPKVVVESEILVYRDYEDGATVSGDHTVLSNGFNYGKAKLGMTSYSSVLISNQADGTALKLAPEQTTPIVSNYNENNSTTHTLGEGKLYIAYNSTASTSGQDVIVYNPTEVANVSDGNLLFGWNPGANFISNKKNWGTGGVLPNVVTAKGDKGRFKVEIVFDTVSKTAYRYVDGILVDEEKNYTTYDASTPYYFYFKLSAQVALDNLTMVNYKTDATNTYSMSKGTMGTNTLSVFLKSDATDSDGRSTDDGTTWTSYSAPYGITLPSTDTVTANADKTYKLAADTFTVTKNGEAIAAASVTAGTKTGEYVITLGEAVDSSATYTVTTKEGLTDIVGATANADANSVTFVPDVFAIDSVSQNGKAVTATYTNTTGEAESFVVIAASYASDKRLAEVVVTPVTAAANSGTQTAAATLTKDIKGKTVKAFVWNSLKDMVPLK